MSTEEEKKPKLSTAEKMKLKMRTTRLAIYLDAAKNKMDENFGSYPCLGMHFGFGEKEITRLTAAVKRHGREDQFDDLTIPVDVLLRTISFIPNERDPRLAARAQELKLQASGGAATTSSSTASTSNNGLAFDESWFTSNNDNNTKRTADDLFKYLEEVKARAEEEAKLQDLPQKTLMRLACSSSTLLYTVLENKCVLGNQGKPAPEKLTAKALVAARKFNEERRKIRAAAVREAGRGGRGIAKKELPSNKPHIVLKKPYNEPPIMTPAELKAQVEALKSFIAPSSKATAPPSSTSKKPDEATTPTTTTTATASTQPAAASSAPAPRITSIKIKNTHWRTFTDHPFVEIAIPEGISDDKLAKLMSMEYQETTAVEQPPEHIITDSYQQEPSNGDVISLNASTDSGYSTSSSSEDDTITDDNTSNPWADDESEDSDEVLPHPKLPPVRPQECAMR